MCVCARGQAWGVRASVSACVCLLVYNNYVCMRDLNEQKTEVVVIAAPNRSRVHSNVTVAVSIDVCGVSVMPKPSIRDIGVVIDDTMSMAVHVSRVCQVTYCQIRSIAKIRKCLTTAACKTIVHALVMSRVDYGNALLFGLPEMLLHKLQMIQNSAARLVTGTHGRDHITPVLFKLHWLPVRYRIEFKLLVLMYQAVHHLGRAYLTSLVTPLCTHSLTEIRGSPFIDNTAVQPRAVWSAGLFCGGSIFVEQSTAHHKRSRHIDNI